MLHKLWYFYIQLNFECSIFTLWYCKFDLSKSFFQHCQLQKGEDLRGATQTTTTIRMKSVAFSRVCLKWDLDTSTIHWKVTVYLLERLPWPTQQCSSIMQLYIVSALHDYSMFKKQSEG